jgi:hypothetical protein
VPFDGHLNCWSPLHSNSHRNNQTKTDDSPISKVLQPLQVSWCSSVPSVSSPTGHFVYYYYVKHGMHWRRPSFRSVRFLSSLPRFIQSSYNEHKDIEIVLQIYIRKKHLTKFIRNIYRTSLYRIRIKNKIDNISDLDYNKTKILFIIVIKIIFYWMKWM